MYLLEEWKFLLSSGKYLINVCPRAILEVDDLSHESVSLREEDLKRLLVTVINCCWQDITESFIAKII